MLTYIKYIDRYRFFLIIVPAILFQVVGSLFYFVIIKNPQLAKIVYTTLKILMILWPIIFVMWLKKIPQVKNSQKTHHLCSFLYGTVIGGAILGLSYLLSGILAENLSFATPMLKEKAEELGIINNYLIFALGLSTLNALFEEYYWRWFIFQSLTTKYSLFFSILISALGFTGHHLVVLTQFFPLPGVLILGSCVFVGGVVFGLIYHKTNSLVGSFICHLLADSAILLIGYKLLF